MIPEVAKNLLPRLPRTFRPALNDQLRAWDFLFPAEQRALEAQLEWLAGMPPEDFRRLFAPVLEIESRMQLPRWDPGATLTVQDTGVLARSPLYPNWRAEVERAFSRIEEGVEKSGRIRRFSRVLICVLPPGLPPSSEPYWPELAKRGAWMTLSAPFGTLLAPLASALAGRKLRAGLEDVEGTWILECDTRLSPLTESTPATVLSWTALSAARREFLSRLNTIRRDLASVDRTNQELRRMDLASLVKAAPRIREFVRSVFLSGNGSLVFNNSFVQWGASEALRRVQPQAMLACFGVRPKLKPFSSVVLFEDQSRSNPVPEENDPAGSLVDGLKLSEYVCLAAQRLAHPLERRVTIMAACDLDRVLVIGAPPPSGDLAGFLRSWLAGA